MERFIYIKNGKVLEFAGATSGFRVTDEAQIALYDSGEYVLNGNTIEAKVKTLEQLKAEKLAELNTNYQTALTFTHTFTDNTVLTLTLTDAVQTELNKRGVSLSVNTDENKTFVYYDNNYQKITRNASDSNGYLEAVADYLEDLREKRTDKTIAINAAQNETELNNVDITF